VSIGADWWEAGFIRNPSRQRLVLALLILAVFWDGLFAGMPRADQVEFLYQLASIGPRIENWLDFLSWNRVIGLGDELLYRPLLYALLVACQRLFGYNFVLWQMANLALHVLTVFGLHALLLRGSLRESALPFLLALLFAVALLGSELVLWHHIIGYVLFCALLVFSLSHVLQYLERGRARDIWIGVVLGLLAEFTYELGVVFNLLVGITLVVYRYQRIGRDAARGGLALGEAPALRHGVAFIAIAVVYPICSYLDLALRGFSHPVGEPLSVANFLLSLDYALRQLAFWLEALLFPTAYRVRPASHMWVEAISYGGTVPQLINYVVIALLIVGTLIYLSGWLKRSSTAGLFGASATALPALLLLFAYSWIIGIGRSIPRGIGEVLYGSVYYSYMAYLIVLAGIALFTWSIERTKIARAATPGREVAVREGDGGENPVSNWRGALLRIGLSGLLILNATATVSIANRFRYEIALPLDLVHLRARLWMQRYGETQDTYFVLGQCKFAGLSFWERAYWERRSGSGVYTKLPPNNVLRRADSVTFVDLLYPRQSYAMQKSRLAGRAVRISDICDEALTGSLGAS
jgi:hypothetical protein